MKIGVIGSGFVGATSAYAMVMRGVGREIVLVDLNKARAQAEADDILHAVPFAGQLDVRAGDYPDLDGCSVVVVTAGVSQRPGENRSELLGRNAKIFHQIIPQILYHAKDAVLVIASNPVDIMTHLTTQNRGSGRFTANTSPRDGYDPGYCPLPRAAKQIPGS